MTKKIRWILGSAILTSSIAVVPAAVVSCGADSSNSNTTTNQTVVNNYIASVEALTGNNVISGNANQLIPTTITNADYATYLNNIPTANSGIVLTFTLTNPNATNGTVDMTITATIGSITKTSTSIFVSGFLTTNQQILKNMVVVTNLIASSDLPAPVITTSALSLENAQPILTTFNISSSQTAQLNKIPNLLISVTSSSTTKGIATLQFSGTINNATTVYSQSYSGFLAGTSTQMQSHLTTYLSDSTNAVNFLQNYLTFNQSFLNDLIFKGNTQTYWGYFLTSPLSNNNFTNITVSYNSTNKTYVINATTNNIIGVQNYTGQPGNGGFSPYGSIPINTNITIDLPFLFSGTLVNYSPINIKVSDSGIATLSWNSVSISYPKKGTTPVGVTIKFIPTNKTLETLIIPYRTILIPTIIF